MMKGYLYKEIKQNRLLIALTAILALCVVLLPMIIIIAEEKSMAREVFFAFAKIGIVFRVLCATLGFISVGAIQSFTLKGDDRKMWGYFVASNPKGIKGFIITKYGLISAISVIYLALCTGCDAVLVLIAQLIGGVPAPFMAETHLYLFFSQLFISAFDIPFTIRFGEKKGSSIKMIILTVIFSILIIILFTDPESIAIVFRNFFLNGELPTILRWGTPIISIAAFVLSGLISSKLYLKGVEQYYK